MKKSKVVTFYVQVRVTAKISEDLTTDEFIEGLDYNFTTKGTGISNSAEVVDTEIMNSEVVYSK